MGDSQDAEIAAYGDALHIVWEDTGYSNGESNSLSIGGDTNIQKNRIQLRASEDKGDTFEKIRIISDNMVKPDSRPKVAAFEDNFYVTWNIGTPEDKAVRNDDDGVGVFVVKGFDKGKTFSEPYKLDVSNQPVGETQVSALDNTVNVVWAGDPDKRIESNIFFSRSFNDGMTFEQAKIIRSTDNMTTALTDTKGTSLNAEIATVGTDIYIPWQNNASPTERNEEILLIRSTDEGNSLIPHLLQM